MRSNRSAAHPVPTALTRRRELGLRQPVGGQAPLRGRSRNNLCEDSLAPPHDRSRQAHPGIHGFGVCSSPRRSGAARVPFCPRLPPTWLRSDRSLPGSVRDTQRDFDDSSHGVRSPSASELGRSLCRFASPTPSVLRVSHPLNGLIPPEPRGFVSRHIRPWGLLTAFRAFPVRSAVTSLDVRFPLAVHTGELSFAGSRLQGVAPTERPFSGGHR